MARQFGPPPRAGAGEGEQLPPPVGEEEIPESVRRLREALGGDQRALDALMGLCWGPLVDYCSRLTRDLDAAEDIAQETFWTVWSRRETFTARATPSLGLLYRVARNLAIDRTRSRDSRLRRLLPLQRVPEYRAESPLDQAEEGELQTALTAAMEALPPRRREVFDLYRFHGLSYAEIADVMGISPQTVANQMSSALTVLRRSLAPFLDRGEDGS